MEVGEMAYCTCEMTGGRAAKGRDDRTATRTFWEMGTQKCGTRPAVVIASPTFVVDGAVGRVWWRGRDCGWTRSSTSGRHRWAIGAMAGARHRLKKKRDLRMRMGNGQLKTTRRRFPQHPAEPPKRTPETSNEPAISERRQHDGRRRRDLIRKRRKDVGE
jgi:hypothetical protein